MDKVTVEVELDESLDTLISGMAGSAGISPEEVLTGLLEAGIKQRQEVRGMTDKWRVNVSIPTEIENRIIDLRKQDEYCRKSFSRIILEMIVRGLREVEKEV